MKLGRSFLVGLCGLLLSGPVLAQQPAELPAVAPAAQSQETTPATPASESSAAASAEAKTAVQKERFLVSAKNLKGATIMDADGKDVGTVDRVVMSADGKLVHLVTEVGGVLGIGGKNIGIPLVALHLRSADEKSGDTAAWLVVDATKETIQAAPALEARNRLELRDTAWVSQNARYFGIESFPAAASAEKSTTLSASDLLDQKVVGRGDTATIAQIEDILFGLTAEPARYAILAYGGTLGIGKEYVVVPFQELEIEAGDDAKLQVSIPYNSKTLAEQQHVTPSDYPELKLSSVRRRIEQRQDPEQP